MDLWALRSGEFYRYAPSPLCQTSLKVWRKNQHLLTLLDSPLRAFLGQPWFPPGKDLTAFRSWHHNGLTWFIDIAPKGNLLEKKQLEDKTHCVIPWLKYLQVSHLLTRTRFFQQTTQPLTNFEKLLLHEGMPRAGLIAKVYNVLLEQHTPTSFPYQLSWEKDLNLIKIIKTLGSGFEMGT